jgi:hypothetical protein
VSRVWRQTITDELATAIDARRGPLTMQEVTTLALAAACEALPLAQRVAELERQVASLKTQPAAPQAAEEMLSF